MSAPKPGRTTDMPWLRKHQRKVHRTEPATDTYRTFKEPIVTSPLTPHIHQPIRGVLAPVVTPFGYDLEVDTRAFIEHCRWLVDAGGVLVVFGTNWEAGSLSFSERVSLLDTLMGAGLPAEKMMPGTGTWSRKGRAELPRHAVNMGAAGVLMLP